MSLRLALALVCLAGSLSTALAYESSIAPAQAAGCGTEIASFRRVIDGDAATGNMNRTVYNRVKPELDRAAAACVAGRDAEARRMLGATKQRYGYR